MWKPSAALSRKFGQKLSHHVVMPKVLVLKAQRDVMWCDNFGHFLAKFLATKDHITWWMLSAEYSIPSKWTRRVWVANCCWPFPWPPQSPWKADRGYWDSIAQNAKPASSFELSQCWHCKEGLPGPRVALITRLNKLNVSGAFLIADSPKSFCEVLLRIYMGILHGQMEGFLMKFQRSPFPKNKGGKPQKVQAKFGAFFVAKS